MFDRPERSNFLAGDLHSTRLSDAIDKIKSLSRGERVTLDNIDAHCFSAIWAEFEQDRKSRPAGGTGKLQINYDSIAERLEVANLEKEAAPCDPTTSTSTSTSASTTSTSTSATG